MNWHYTIHNKKLGPVTDVEFQRLIQQGVITRETLVCREDMDIWSPYDGEVVHITKTSFPIEQIDTRLIGFNAEQKRKLYIRYEASVRAIGFLYFSLGWAWAFWLLSSFFCSCFISNHDKKMSGESMVFAFYFGIFIVLVVSGFTVVGKKLDSLQSWTRGIVAIFSGVGLLLFPVGTLINGYFLYLLFSKKGEIVFSPEYQEVIQQTPHLKCRIPIEMWIVLVLVLVFVWALVMSPFSM